MLNYKPPEYDTKIVTYWYDIWSFGCLMYYLYTKKHIIAEIIEIRKNSGKSYQIKDITQKEIDSITNNLKKNKLRNLL